MKTAIIKTGFWQDDDVFELNSDTRLLYLCLLTNPQREILPAFRCSDRMLSAYTGYNKDLIDICRKQLIGSGRILYEEADDKWFYILTKQDFVQPGAGRLTGQVYEREYEKLPTKIQQIIDKMYRNSTGTTSGHNNNSNNNNNNKHNKAEQLTKDVKETFSELQVVFKQPTTKLNTYQDAMRKVLDGNFTKDEIIAAAKALSASPYHQGQNEQKVVYANIAFLFGFTHAENMRRIGKWYDASQLQNNGKKKDYGF